MLNKSIKTGQKIMQIPNLLIKLFGKTISKKLKQHEFLQSSVTANAVPPPLKRRLFNGISLLPWATQCLIENYLWFLLCFFAMPCDIAGKVLSVSFVGWIL